jgi:hypothetical protein
MKSLVGETLSLAGIYESAHTVPQLKALTAALGLSRPGPYKSDKAASIARLLDSDDVHAVWERLDDVQKDAAAETAYSDSSLFDAQRFQAKFGRLPQWSADGKLTMDEINRPFFAHSLLAMSDSCPIKSKRDYERSSPNRSVPR